MLPEDLTSHRQQLPHSKMAIKCHENEVKGGWLRFEVRRGEKKGKEGRVVGVSKEMKEGGYSGKRRESTVKKRKRRKVCF